ncbi:hypothetical protein B0181_01900 [Moraxella caviae]|uniref:Uncharacterized protein n=1 Tax=Moraxella caviae TaxID=34060 RepID=A0A1T0AAP3_9GAMM|nr:hypothetical protein B0181_01900 [Moraxella caviae]
MALAWFKIWQISLYNFIHNLPKRQNAPKGEFCPIFKHQQGKSCTIFSNQQEKQPFYNGNLRIICHNRPKMR